MKWPHFLQTWVPSDSWTIPSEVFCIRQMGQPMWDMMSLPFLVLRMVPERTVRGLQGNVDPSFMALLVAETGCFVYAN